MFLYQSTQLIMDLAIHLDRTSITPLYQQLTDKIRGAVLEGRLKPNQKLPSSRSLAKSLTISRSTVTQSYEQLESEGYLETRCGSGTYVCHQIPDEWLNSTPIEPVTNKKAKDSLLSQFGKNLISISSLEVSEPELAFAMVTLRSSIFQYNNGGSFWLVIAIDLQPC